MPNELLRVADDIEWLRTIIRRRSFGIESEFHFKTADGVLRVATDGLANIDFQCELIHTDCLAIWDHSSEERGWTKGDRFELRINDDDHVAFSSIRGSFVRWGRVDSGSGTDTLEEDA